MHEHYKSTKEIMSVFPEPLLMITYYNVEYASAMLVEIQILFISLPWFANINLQYSIILDWSHVFIAGMWLCHPRPVRPQISLGYTCLKRELRRFAYNLLPEFVSWSSLDPGKERYSCHVTPRGTRG